VVCRLAELLQWPMEQLLNRPVSDNENG